MVAASTDRFDRRRSKKDATPPLAPSSDAVKVAPGPLLLLWKKQKN